MVLLKHAIWALTLLPIAAAALAYAAPAALPGEGKESVLSGLRKERPRLLFSAGDQARIEKLAKDDELLDKLVAENRELAEQILAEPTVEHKLKGPRLLDQSRNCLRRVLNLGMAWRLHKDRRYAERATKEMLAAAAFKDWNPSHFLDVAEMTAALAVGCDWLGGALADKDRAAIRKAIVEKGLRPGLDIYRTEGWWAKGVNNWNMVCNGGMVLGALEVAEEEPALAREIVERAVKSAPLALASYAPDGAWFEGPSYWGYATEFTALLISGLEGAIGSDFRLAAVRGLERTGEARMHGISPAGLYFNYADGNQGPAGPSAAMFWLSRKFDRPDYAWYHREMLKRQFAAAAVAGKGYPCSKDRFRALEIAWFDERGEAPKPGSVPLDRFFRGRADTVSMRSSWEEAGALWAAFKGGDNSLSHAHMDVGGFVLDADGVRWAMDLGPDDYNLPDYFQMGENGRRWKYYRLNSLSHNVLVIGGRLQRAAGLCRITAFASRRERVGAVLDMSAAYKDQASRVLRGLAMLERSRVLVQDEIDDPRGGVRWGMVTPARVELDGARATLVQGDRKLLVEVLEPAGSRWETVSTDPGDPSQKPNTGTTMLAFKTKAGSAGGKLRMAVLLTPLGERWKPLPPPNLEPLSSWEDEKRPPAAP